MDQQLIAGDWQPFFTALATAAAALAGLVFVAMSLSPEAILRDPLTRTRAFATASGFLITVAWALSMLVPVRVAPLGSYSLIGIGLAGFMFLLRQQVRVRKAGLSILRGVTGSILILTPVPAGIIGLLWPASEVSFLVLALAASLAVFFLFAQSWSLVVRGVTTVDSRWRERD